MKKKYEKPRIYTESFSVEAAKAGCECSTVTENAPFMTDLQECGCDCYEDISSS